MFNRFWGVLCQPVHQESNLVYFSSFPLFWSTVHIKSNLKRVKLKHFFSFSFWSHSAKFGKLISNRFWSVYFQTVHTKSNSRYFCSSSLFGSALWFLLKTRLQVRFFNIKIIFVLCFILPEVMQQSLVNWFSADFGRALPTSTTRIKLKAFSQVHFVFFLIIRLRVRMSKFKIVFAPSLRSLEVNW